MCAGRRGRRQFSGRWDLASRQQLAALSGAVMVHKHRWVVIGRRPVQIGRHAGRATLVTSKCLVCGKVKDRVKDR
jgi:hypothetical protein